MKPTRVVVSAALCAQLLLAGCQQTGPVYTTAPPTPATFESAALIAEEIRYATGAPVTLRLTNGTRRPISYNLCRSNLERATDDDWVLVRPISAGGCTAELRTLLPGQAVNYTFPTERQARPGDYRVRTDVYDSGARVSLVSRIFRLNREDSD